MKKLLLLLGLCAMTNACSDDASSGGSGGGGAAADGGMGGVSGTSTGGGGASEGGSTSTSTGGNAPAGCESYLFCEDFEDGAPGDTPPGWTERAGWDQGGSRAVLSDEHARSGSQSLKGAVGTNGQYRVERALDGNLATNHWGRIFYKVETPLAMDGIYVHNTFVAFGRPASDNGSESRVVDTVMAPNGTHQFLFNVPDDSCCAGSSYDFSYDGDWHCVEWFVDGDAQSFRFFYEGEEVTDIAFNGVAGAHIEDFSSVIVGWINYQSPSMPGVGWFDDLALHDERIGCD